MFSNFHVTTFYVLTCRYVLCGNYFKCCIEYYSRILVYLYMPVMEISAELLSLACFCSLMYVLLICFSLNKNKRNLNEKENTKKLALIRHFSTRTTTLHSGNSACIH